MTRLGVGLISVGWMGRAHSRAYRNVREHFPELTLTPELVVAADLAERGRAEAVDLLGYGRAVADYRELLADPAVDVVSICAPNFLHREMALEAAAAGKPFWIEKPMGRGLHESAEIAQAAQDAGILTCVGFNYRNAPAIEVARQLVADGRLGTVTNVRVSFLADYSSDPQAPLMWRFNRERAGSGVYGDLLSHGFDLASYVTGQAVREVSAAQGTYIATRPVLVGAAVGHNATGGDERGPVENEDYAAVIARLEYGALAVFESSRIAIGPRAEYVIDVYGTEGSLRWDFQRLNELQVAFRGDRRYGYTTLFMGPGDGEHGRFQPGAGTSMGFDDLKTIEASLFLRSLETGVQHGPSVADGVAAARVADAAERSGASGRWVPVP
ncbi:MAG TPA: Gfo/Idh/MocA family oxidoreductase [Microbacterium sp.]|nr:Gfo/Idh/MocA family oxidoreductase [Microbacterium sp.]